MRAAVTRRSGRRGGNQRTPISIQRPQNVAALDEETMISARPSPPTRPTQLPDCLPAIVVRARIILGCLFVIVATGGAGSAGAATSLAVSPMSVALGAVQAEPGAGPNVLFALTNNGTNSAVLSWRYSSPTYSTEMAPLVCQSESGDLTVLAPGQSCVIGRRFEANQLARSGYLGPGVMAMELIANQCEVVIPVLLSFTIIPAFLTIDHSKHDFGQVLLGQEAVVQRVVTNNTDQPMDLGASVVGASGGLDSLCDGYKWYGQYLCGPELYAAAASFTLVAPPDCHPIAPRGSCTLTLQFAPQADFAMTASVEVSANNTPSAIAQTIEFNGTGVPRKSVASTTLAVEYINAALGQHYFVTAYPAEISVLDAGKFTGWVRTGRSFWVSPPEVAASAGTSPVCRYYSRPETGVNSHFYSASAAECAFVASELDDAWILESSNAFGVSIPDSESGGCPAGTSPLYRMYNNQASFNHRFTTSLRVRDLMVKAGWVAEGYGPNAVVMCVPQ